jgi:hypothetical protein
MVGIMSTAYVKLTLEAANLLAFKNVACKDLQVNERSPYILVTSSRPLANGVLPFTSSRSFSKNLSREDLLTNGSVCFSEAFVPRGLDIYLSRETPLWSAILGLSDVKALSSGRLLAGTMFLLERLVMQSLITDGAVALKPPRRFPFLGFRRCAEPSHGLFRNE